MNLSTSGEAANMEIALLLGLTGERAPQLAIGCQLCLRARWRCWDPGINSSARPRTSRRSLAQVWLRSADEVLSQPRGYARMAVEHI